MNSLYTPELGQLSEYAERLRRYSDSDLEDIYCNIHVLQCGARYQMLLREMERRGILPEKLRAPEATDLGEALLRMHALGRRPRLARAVLGFLGGTLTALLTIALLVPIWAFVVLWDFVGIQTWPVYLTIVVGGPLVALSAVRDWCGPLCPAYARWLGLGAGLLLFAFSGMAGAALTALLEPRAGGGGGLLAY
jgi:hypothetical protein